MKFELSLAPSYVSHWTYVEGIRELIQNAIDAGDPQVYYDAEDQRLTVFNAQGNLSTQTLLLGVTSKVGDVDKIGHFGEGYKIALLVLTRKGLPCGILNGQTQEHWVASLERSRKYKEKVLTIRTSPLAQAEGITFYVDNITEEMYDDLQQHFLILREKPVSMINTSLGDLILDEQEAGNVYVSGLFVSHMNGFKYGYSFNPSILRLDRDRKAVGEFELAWNTSRMWSYIDIPERVELITHDIYQDCRYIYNNHIKAQQTLENAVRETFKETYGDKAIPVTTQAESDRIKEKFGGEVETIIASPQTVQLVSDQIEKELEKTITVIEKLSTYEKLCNWVEKYQDNITEEMQEELDEILKEVEQMQD